jgi:uncharacterized protein (UPF0179 family)
MRPKVNDRVVVDSVIDTIVPNQIEKSVTIDIEHDECDDVDCHAQSTAATEHVTQHEQNKKHLEEALKNV